jgi:hypothetical protein
MKAILVTVLFVLCSVTHGLCGYLGIDYKENKGVMVLTEVTCNSPASEAGLCVGDSVVGFNRSEIKNPDQVIMTIRQLPAGTVCDFRIMRAGRSIDFSIQLWEKRGAHPASNGGLNSVKSIDAAIREFDLALSRIGENQKVFKTIDAATLNLKNELDRMVASGVITQSQANVMSANAESKRIRSETATLFEELKAKASPSEVSRLDDARNNFNSLLAASESQLGAEENLALRSAWRKALEGLQQFYGEPLRAGTKRDPDGIYASVAMPFSASSGAFLDDARMAVIGGKKGELSVFDTTTGGEVWRGAVNGNIRQVYCIGDQVYALAHPSGMWEGGDPSFLWKVDWRSGCLTRWPLKMYGNNYGQFLHMELVGHMPASGDLVFLGSQKKSEDPHCQFCNLYSVNPDGSQPRLLATFVDLLGCASDSWEQRATRCLDVSKQWAALTEGNRREHDGDDDGAMRKTIAKVHEMMRIPARLAELGVVPCGTDEFATIGPSYRCLSVAGHKPLAIFTREQLVGRSVKDPLGYVRNWREWQGDGQPILGTWDGKALQVGTLLYFCDDGQSAPVVNYPRHLLYWLETTENSKINFLNNLNGQPIRVERVEGEKYGYPLPDSVWMAGGYSTVVGNLNHESGECSNSQFVGDLTEDHAGQHPIYSTLSYNLPKLKNALADEPPLALGVLKKDLAFFSTPQGMVYCQKAENRWMDTDPVVSLGCFAGLHNFRDAKNGDWLLAEGAGWTHVLQRKDNTLEGVFRVLSGKDNGMMVLLTNGHYMATHAQTHELFFSYKGHAYPFEQFDLLLNRPEHVLEKLGAPAEAVGIAKQLREKRLKRMGVTEELLQPDFHVPEIEIVSQIPATSDADYVNVSIKASDSKYPLDRLRVYVNNVPINGKEGELLRDAKLQTLERTIQLKLAVGRNKIQVSVLNSAGAESLYANAEVNCTALRPKPTLYAVAMGVSEYSNPEWNLKYAAKDARDILDRIRSKSGSSYGEVKELLLTDREVTKETIAKVREFLSQATIDDTVLIFVAGHGLLDSKYDYYFGTSDIDFNNPSEKGIAFEEFDDLLADMPCLRKSFLIDTCHAGELDEDEKKALAASQAAPSGQLIAMHPVGARGMSIKPIEGARGKSEWYDRLQGLFVDLRRGSGSTILSSSAGAEYALESSEQQNGLFTYAVLEALDGTKDADANKDGSVQMSELGEYVKKRVAGLTNNKQTPNTRRVNIEGDFVLSKSK